MYEDHSVEEKYLYNFSSKEKIEFSCQQRAWRTAMNSYMVSLNTLINLDSNAIFGDFEPEPNTFLEIKYVLNRIAANDIRDTIFEVSDVDNVRKANKLALQVARSFQKNTVCKKIILHKVGLTDRDMLPVLRVLRHKELDLLDISGNKITDRTLDVLKGILVDPNTHWKDVRLGKITLSKKQRESLKKYPNLSFTALVPLSERLRDKCCLLISKNRER